VFYGSIAFIPLSCIVCCGAAGLIPNDTAKAIFGIAGMFSPLIGLGGMILMWSDRSRFARSLDLAQQADEMGMTFAEKPGKRELKLVRSFQLFRDSSSDAGRNGMTGAYEDASLVVMDYSCAWGVGGDASVLNQTAIVFEDFAEGTPDLVVYPKCMLDKLSDAVGLPGQAIKVPKADKFNKKYGLYAAQAVAATSLFTPKLTDLCLDEASVVLEVTAGNVLVYWYETDIPPDELAERLAIAHKIAEALRRE